MEVAARVTVWIVTGGRSDMVPVVDGPAHSGDTM